MNPLVQRYFGTAIGKGRQGAKTEVERLKLGEITCEQGVIEIAKMCAFCSTPDLESFLKKEIHKNIPFSVPWPAYMSHTYLHHILQCDQQFRDFVATLTVLVVVQNDALTRMHTLWGRLHV